ncbi:phage holin family protein [uncultured Devosia sp.]|uniref:phage holin family protein n=1 Tax=uncultured Devosia sp. TaxID=211434 RepID=UPI0035CA3414
MSSSNETRSLPELIGGLASDISGLFRKEIQLAKTEASEKFSQTMNGVGVLLAGAILALGALGVILTAIVAGVGALLIAQGMDEATANALAALIVAVVVGLIAWILISRGLGALKGSNMSLNRTANSLSRDADVVKERL